MQQPGTVPPPPPALQPRNGIAIAGMVCGILGLVMFWTVWLGVILGILGVVFGAVGLTRARQTGVNLGAAKAGIITGAIGIVASIIWVVLVVTVFEGSFRFQFGTT